VTNIPTPYRIALYSHLFRLFGEGFVVLFAARREPNRLWRLGTLPFPHHFLAERITAKRDGFNYIHNNLDVVGYLRRFDPDVVITTGFNPTHLYAWGYAKWFGKRHIPMTDGTLLSETHLSWLHRLVRRVVFSTSDAFIGASQGSLALYHHYGIDSKKCFQSPLTVENEVFINSNGLANRPYDLLFVGNFIEIKNPLFFVAVLKSLCERGRHPKVLLIGEGRLKEALLLALADLEVEVSYVGFVEPIQIPAYYQKAKVLLFPTQHDAWGMVAHEALASGTPVVVTPYAGVAYELVQDDINGFILPLVVSQWVVQVDRILCDVPLWERLSKQAFASVLPYSSERAVEGVRRACEYRDAK